MYYLTQEISSLAIFVIISSITPGPNNLMLLHGGLHSGFSACKSHILGISCGMLVLTLLSYWGIATIVLYLPLAIIGLKVIGSIYLLWLTWVMHIKGIVPSEDDLIQEKNTWLKLPLNFWQAVAFQWVNPKAWIMVITMPSLALASGSNPLIDNALIYLIVFMLNITCISLWAYGGNSLRRLLHRDKLMHLMHTVIIVATLYSAISIWI